ncbi:acetyl-CoA hydrolase/transferase family protein [Rurimicrobium arvi]|uniref:Acetyl-CoA hydrolase/transferase C-terminal domain-containing protein n=1 Tax=Rurimicrobium arvi TaxID=2049916 RepID=A0ABP8MFX2_9BACT
MTLYTPYVSAESAVRLVNSGDRVFIHGSAATPVVLVNALLHRAAELRNVELVSISTYGHIDWNHPEVQQSFYMNSLFVSANVREWVNSGNGDYVPIFLSEIPGLFEKGILPLDVALVQVSPPDEHGYCTLGTSVDAALSAVQHARIVIAQVNPRMPRVLGDGIIPVSRFSAMVWQESELPEVHYATKADGIVQQIGRNVAALIEDGATLQMGIGAIPDVILQQLEGHRGLGVHTEMFSDGVIPLVEKGVITNEHKLVEPGKMVSTFVLGSRRLYDFVDNNPFVVCKDVSFVNDTDIIRRNPKVVSINSALEVDLTGQVCADSIGVYQYSGIGGQMDFMRGAALSEGGKPIIALPSATREGTSRIVPFLRQGAGVVTTRGHVHYVATEYGVVNLYGRNMEQRARLLINIAHPDHREALERAYFERFGSIPKA